MRREPRWAGGFWTDVADKVNEYVGSKEISDATLYSGRKARDRREWKKLTTAATECASRDPRGRGRRSKGMRCRHSGA